jgi:hypothetical protein
MSTLLLIAGGYLLVGGCFIGWFRLQRPERLRRLTELKSKFGERQGNIIHFISYVVLQIGVGIALIFRGLAMLALLIGVAPGRAGAAETTKLHAEITDASHSPRGPQIAVMVRRGIEADGDGLFETIKFLISGPTLTDVWTNIYLCDPETGQVNQLMEFNEDVSDEAGIAGWTREGEVVFDLKAYRPSGKEARPRTWQWVKFGTYGGFEPLNARPAGLLGSPKWGEARELGVGFDATKKSIRRSTGTGFLDIFSLDSSGYLVFGASR